MNETGANGVGSGERGPRDGDSLWDAIQALAGRVGEALTGPEAQQVKEELETRAREVGRQIDAALEGPEAQSLKERVAELLRTVQQGLRR